MTNPTDNNLSPAEPTTADLVAFLRNESCFQTINNAKEKGQSLFNVADRLEAVELSNAKLLKHMSAPLKDAWDKLEAAEQLAESLSETIADLDVEVGKAAAKLEESEENLLLTHIDWQKQFKRADKAESTIKHQNNALEAAENHTGELLSDLKVAHQDIAFYRCCALSGEIPKEGSEPSALIKEHNDG